ncbi:MAG: zinc-binding dehydrogenase [Candidatus Hodarchaeota archaeon]
MKALILKAIEELELKKDVPKPTPSKNEVLIRVRYCGICGSDLEAYNYGKVLTPIILGHEFSGEIEEIGSKVVGWKIGDRVTAYPGEFCRECYFCKKGEENRCIRTMIGLGITVNGALAEYVKISSKSLCKLPDSVSYENGALVEPLAVGYHGVKISGIHSTDIAVVIGAGTIGLSTIQALKLSNIENIYVIEPSEYNLNLALQMGVQKAARPSKINKIGPKFVFDCAGFPKTYKDAIRIVQRGGTVVLLGVHFENVPISFLELIVKEVNLKGSFGYSFEEFKEIIALLSQKKIQTNLILSKKVKLENVIDEGFHELLRPDRKAAKILVEI